MKRLLPLFLVVFLLGLNNNSNAQSELKEYITDSAGNKYRTQVDNINYWVKLAEKGLVPFNPSIPVKPAEFKSSLISIKGVVQNSPDIVIYDDPDHIQSENSVFVDPNDILHVLNSNNSDGWDGSSATTSYGASYFNSYSGGNSWSGGYEMVEGDLEGDPATCIGTNGRQYIGAISLGNGQGVAYSDDGSSWTYVTVGADLPYTDLLDKNHLWIDNTNSSQAGNVYDAWTRFEDGQANDGEIEFSRSTNDGVSWSTPFQISSGVSAGEYNQGVNIQCNNTGWVFAVWAIYDDWGSGNFPEDAIGFARSGNGGVSFYSANRIVDNIKGIRGWNNNSTGKAMRVNSYPSMAVDVSGGPNNGDIYVVWANVGVPGTNTGTNVSVYMTKSTNGGVAWSTPSRVNVSAASDHAAFMPWITCDPVSGNLYVIYYDDVNLAGTSSAVETLVAYSDDGGASWTDMTVSDVAFTPSPIPGLAMGYFGDYIGISAYDGKVYPTWTDNRSGKALTYVSPLDFGGNCVASGGCSEHIANVQFGTINKSSACDGYADYRDLVNTFPLNETETITVTNGVTTYGDDQCGIWVDWNHDGDFDDASEIISVANTPGVGPYTASITPPTGATLGECTIRVRITWTGAVDPCGTTPYGEVEDYTINLSPGINEWTGAFNHYWHNSGNWSLGHIPTADEDVFITTAGYQPPTCDFAHTEECNDLTINTGSILNIANEQLTLNGNVKINGTLGMIHDDAEIICYGDFVWNSGSTANITNPAVISVYGGHWSFNTGANANFADGFVDFVGTSDCWIRAYSSNSSFYNLRNYKSGGAKVGVSNFSSNDLVVNNLVYIYTGSILESWSDNNVVIKGPFNYYGTFDFTTGSNTGSVVFDGISQQINGYGTGSGVFNNVVFSSSGTATLYNAGIDVMGDLTIESGSFNSNGLGVEVHGSWDNTGGTYIPGGSTVTFNGNGVSSPHNVFGANTFYDIIQLNTGTYLRFNGPTTISNNLELHFQCWAYDLMTINGTLNINDAASRFGVYSGGNATVATIDQGGEVVVASSTFTANDLVDGGILGTYHLISGEINLTKSGYPDFNGDITIEDGQFMINSTSSCYWTYDSDLSLTMSGGILDISTPGCYVYNGSNTLALDISGGTIRTSGYFFGDDPDFTPTSGLLELYSTNDAVFRTQNGCSVYNVLINKSVKSGTKKFKLSERDIAAGIKPGGGGSPKANQVNLTSDVDINGDFTIDGGIFNTATHDMNVAGDWTNNVGDGAFLENTNLVTFDGASNADITTDETFYNMSLNKTNGSFDGLELMGITLNVSNNLDILNSAIEMNTGSTLDIGNDIHIASGAGLNAFNDSGLSIFVGGNWTNDNAEWNGISGYSPGTETLTFDGSSDQIFTTSADKEDIGNLVINMTNGEFRSNDSINVMHNFTLTQGVWHDNVNDLTHYFQGDFFIASGAGAIWNSLTGNTVIFKGIGNQNIHNPIGTGYFKKVIVDKTDFAKKKNYYNEGSEVVMEGYKTEAGTKGGKAMMVNLTSDIDIEGSNASLTIEEGTLNLNGNTLWTMGDININGGGKLIVDDGALLKVNDGDALSINSGGILEAIGSSGNNAAISNRNTGYFSFTVNNGGTISARYATFQFVNYIGLYFKNGSLLDPANPLDYCTFQNVEATALASDITFGNDQVITCTGVNFPDNPYYNIYKSNNAGNITFDAATGDYAGPEYEYDPVNHVHWADVEVELNLNVMLEGPYNGTNMNTDLKTLGLIPLSQPFNSNTSADWFYSGPENVSSIPPNVVDWVLVKIKDATDAASSASAPLVAVQAAFLLNDGSVVDLDGSSNLNFTGISYSSGLFPVVWQRNHLGVISSTSMTRTGGVYTWDFTTAGSAYSNTNPGEKLLGGGVYGMYAGDVSGSGKVTSTDISWWQNDAGLQKYQAGDANLDSQADNIDKNDFCVPNLGNESQIPGSKKNDN